MQIGAPLHLDAQFRLQWIEVASSLQIPAFHIIGLPAPEVAEARERVRAAIDASGFDFPRRRVVLNLSPASVRKRGTGLDLAIALAVLASGSDRDPGSARVLAWGELGLDGAIKPAGQLTRLLYAAWKDGVERVILSQEESNEARKSLRLIKEAGLFSGPAPKIQSVRALCDAWDAAIEDPEIDRSMMEDRHRVEETCFGTQSEHEIGHAEHRDDHLLPLPPLLERLIGVVASGHHHLCLLGPKGTGKSHALDWLVAVLPEPSPRQFLSHRLVRELNQERAVAEAVSRSVPVCRIGMGARAASLIGSVRGGLARPGVFSLAHAGLLIADEIPEWPRDAREALREPLERGLVTLTRAGTEGGTTELPARFLLAANGNLCPCGGWPEDMPLPMEQREQAIEKCRCLPVERERYRSRLSGPLLDRVDFLALGPYGRVNAPGVAPRERALERRIELRARVRETRMRLESRLGAAPGLLQGLEVERALTGNAGWEQWQQESAARFSLRGRHKIGRAALTLAAWDGIESPMRGHFTEASCYRPERFGFRE